MSASRRPATAKNADDAREPLIQQVAVGIILPLRHAVLRAGLPLESACFPGDQLASTIHLAARAGDQVLACATYLASPYDGEPAYQLRGMATAPAVQGTGLGRRLLIHAEGLLDAAIGLRWCNARLTAIGFYARLGWTVASDVFDIPTAGPHRRMIRRLAAQPTPQPDSAPGGIAPPR
jgi:GNAT superfamily N-acetyltransferase